MTGRDLIVFILQNNLENIVVFNDGRIPGLMTVGEAAAKWHTGESTVKSLYVMDKIRGVTIGSDLYIYADQENPFYTKG